jgi:hypothetical protein
MMFRSALSLSPSWAVLNVRSLNCRRPFVAVALAMLMGVMVAGCATGDYAYVKTISTGERIQIPLHRGAPVMAQKGNVQIRHAALIPSATPEKKQLMYLFDLQDKSPVPPKSIVVEDVSEDKPVLMLDDQAPKLVNQRWTSISRPFSGDEAAMIWVTHLDDSMRVFRFTVTGADGSKTVLDQGWMVPGWTKVPMRRALGLK